jgi:GTP-binding protein
VKPNQTVKVLSRDGKLKSSRAASPRCWPSAASSACRSMKARSRRHRRHRRPDQGDRRRHVCDPSVTEPLEAQPIDPPTLSMTFRINDSPARRPRRRQGHQPRHPRPPAARSRRQRRLRSREGRRQGRVRSRRPRRTAARRADRNHAPRRLRAGVSRPARDAEDENGEKLEPIEEVVIDVDDEHSGVVVQKLSRAQGRLLDMRPSGGGRPPGVPRADPRPDRLPGRTAVRHARHRRHEPPVPRLRSRTRARSRAAAPAC